MVSRRANVPPKGDQAIMDWIWAVIDALIPWPWERRFRRWLERHPCVVAGLLLLLVGGFLWSLMN